MAHRILTQIVVTSGRVFTRAFAEAWKQAQASQKYAAARAANSNLSSSSPGSGNMDATLASHGLTLDEACKILNVSPPKPGAIGENARQEMDKVLERFKKLFDMNNPKKGGSFYLQSKILRARERIEMEYREYEEMVEIQETKRRGGGLPKMYRD
jgi:import inner membrane translocase subunit TIM16